MIKKLIAEANEISTKFEEVGGNGIPATKVIYNNKDFLVWKENLLFELGKLQQESLVLEIIDLLKNGFNSGWKDEKDFNSLTAKLLVLNNQLEDFSVNQESVTTVNKMKKGTTIKTAFDEYVLVKQVGAGGNARVFSATNKDNVEVAIKFVEKDTSMVKLKRFKNEIYFCEHSNHKNIVHIFDRGYVFLDGRDYLFYVMPLLNVSLRDKINTGIEPHEAIEIFVGLLEGLKYAHKKAVIHRDIKPENILFDEEETPIICDFGIAHFSKDEMFTSVETRVSDRMANFQYAAPEQRVKGGTILPQTDIYALGLILNEMFTKEIPQASGYKKIADVNQEYSYLDEIFELLFKQNASERLYPEEIILTELKIRAEEKKRNEEIELLKNTIININDPGVFNVKVISKDFREGNIVFKLNADISNEWLAILNNGNYTHSSVMGYEVHKVKRISNNEIGMPVKPYDYGNESTISSIVKYVLEWINITNGLYTSSLKRQEADRQRKLEEKRLREIAELEKKNKMTELISKL